MASPPRANWSARQLPSANDAARLARPGLKVLFITGYAANAAMDQGRLDDGMAVLVKPFAMDDLAAKVGQMIRRD